MKSKIVTFEMLKCFFCFTDGIFGHSKLCFEFLNVKYGNDSLVYSKLLRSIIAFAKILNIWIFAIVSLFCAVTLKKYRRIGQKLCRGAGE